MTVASLARSRTRDTTAFEAALAVTVVSLLVGASVSSPTLVRGAVSLPVACLLVGLATASPQLALYGLMAWLAALGLVRRLLTTLAPSTPLGDPLLLVGPALLLVLFVIAVQRGALRGHTRLSRAVLALTVALAISAVNPLQGALTVGLGGAMLVVVPMLAFWVGRSLLDERSIGVLVRLLGGLALLAAVYGLVQTLYGVPGWDQRWIDQGGYVALNVGGTIRAFGTSSSASEYAALLAVGILSWRATARRHSLLPAAVVAIGVTTVALWLESARGIVVLTLAALWLTLAASRRIPLGRALLVGATLLALLPTAVGSLRSSQSGKSATSALVAHQVEGLGEPFGQKSTLNGHFERVVNGINEGLANPLGRGVGATTTAASKYEGKSAGTEADLGNAPVAAGLIGLILYVLVAVYGIGGSYRLAQARRTTAALAALGVVVVTFLQWLNGGQYVVAPLPWLFLGWVDAARSRSSDAEITAPRGQRSS